MKAEKFDFLMKITNTGNSTLGRILSFDPSYIGRIRSGKRGLPKKQPFIEPAVIYFVRNITDDYQRKALTEKICPDKPWPEDNIEAKDLIISWLSKEDDFGTDLISESNLDLPFVTNKDVDIAEPSKAVNENVQLYYGNEGKRIAVEKFLNTLCDMDTPQTLLLYSDENFSWIYENNDFAKRWAGLLLKFASKGGRIKIIHTISRGIDEMLEAVKKWLPLYMSGTIRPYFYPKLRDGVLRRTLFIAKDHSAIISNSVGDHTQEALNILLYDKDSVKALEVEFQDYLALCRPLMDIFNLQNSDVFWKLLYDFEKKDSNIIMLNPVPSHFTMPASVSKAIYSRTDCKWLSNRQKNLEESFIRQLQKGFTITEILNLPSPDLVKADKVPVPMCDLFDNPKLCYTAGEFKEHLENLVKLLKENDNYRVILFNKAPNDIILYAKEDIGAVISRSVPPTTVFGISQQNMIASLWEYLQNLLAKVPTKKMTIGLLKKYIEEL